MNLPLLTLMLAAAAFMGLAALGRLTADPPFRLTRRLAALALAIALVFIPAFLVVFGFGMGIVGYCVLLSPLLPAALAMAAAIAFTPPNTIEAKPPPRRPFRWMLWCFLGSFGIVLIPIGILATDVGIYSQLGLSSPVFYPSVLDRYPPELKAKLLDFFPPVVPVPASDPRFFYITPADGQERMELRCFLPPQHVALLSARAQAAAIAALPGNKIEEFDGHQVPLTPQLRNAANTGFESHGPPATFMVYILGVRHDGDWTTEYGVAIDPATHEVIYWLNASY